MKTKITNLLSLGIILMGLVHIAATFTPVIAGKLSPLSIPSQNSFTYMSLMCGALLVLGGSVVRKLSGLVKEHNELHLVFLMTIWFLAIDGILATVFMPVNPCAWIILCLSIPLLVINQFTLLNFKGKENIEKFKSYPEKGSHHILS